MTRDMSEQEGLPSLQCQAGQGRTHSSPLASRSSQAREDVSSVPAAQGLASHKHSHTSGPLLGTRLVGVQVPRAPRRCPCSHGQPPAFADPYVPWLMLSPSWHAFSLCPGPTHTCVAPTLPSPQSTLLPPGDGALPAEPPCPFPAPSGTEHFLPGVIQVHPSHSPARVPSHCLCSPHQAQVWGRICGLRGQRKASCQRASLSCIECQGSGRAQTLPRLLEEGGWMQEPWT
ncbi:unnamed protein product [Pipistrellus nathusii]|uniref:Uncharacterized protein n=1 Tax=Pipistrellus nathusii TaxID=59473 RepID=A0ABN9ZAM5_PIPNA